MSDKKPDRSGPGLAKILEVLTLLVAVASAIISAQQAWSARGSARDASEQLLLAREQAAAAKAQARYVEKIADLSDKSLAVAKDERDAALRLAKASEQSAQLSREQTATLGKEISAAEQRERDARRPRLTISRTDIRLNVGDPPTAELTIDNLGPTSAHDVWFWSRWITQDGNSALPSTPSCSTLKPDSSATIGRSASWMLTRSAPWTEAEMARWSPKSPQVLIGVLCYKDEYGRPWETFFCRSTGKTGKGAVQKCTRGEVER